MAEAARVAKILVVDDNPDNVDLARAVVEAAGYTALSAADGIEALERVKESPPDLILLDVMMPRLDGMGVLQKLRENPATAQIPVIMLTAKAAVSDRVAGLTHGADDYVPKPFEAAELMARIHTLLKRSEKLRYLNPLMGVLGDWFSERGVERLSRELEVAREIQMSLLPRVPPPMHGIELGAVLFSSETVSGDFYDFLAMPDGRLGISVGDVSGKGIPAALLMVMVRTLFRVTASDGDPPGRVLARINRYLCRDIPPSMFVTMFFCLLGPDRQLVYGDAGHVKPVLLRPGQPPRVLEAEGTILGVMDEAEFDERRIQLSPGDLLALYTDGVVESVGPDGRMLGTDGFCALMEANRGKSPQAIAEAIAGEIRKSPGPLRDDLTLLVLRASGSLGDRGSPAILRDDTMTDGGPEGTFVLMSDPQHLARLREWLREELARLKVEHHEQFGLQVAVGEICSNSIRHAYAGLGGKPIHVSVQGSDDRLVIEVRDFGKKYDPQSYRPPDLEAVPEGGFGLHLVRQFVDELSYDVTQEQGTRWILVKYRRRG